MLSQKTIATVKATVPVLHEGGEALTKHFYARMFTHNPEVLPFFNAANQNKGAQQHALAAAICAYAANIDNLEVLGSAVERIAQKHASLRIAPEHYPIVGENLLASIKEVLGDAATDDILQAWGEAYGFLADILTGREKQIYQNQIRTPGGWDGFKPFTVVRKKPESDTITSFYLEPADGKKPPAFKAGQYITVRVPDAKGNYTTMRNYSLSDASGEGHFRISVKREPGARAGAPAGYVSNLLHNSIAVGSTIEVAPPCGDFHLALDAGNTRPLVFIAAGVGITPVLSMLLTACDRAPERSIFFFHAARDENVQAFRPTVEYLVNGHNALQTFFCYSGPVPEGVVRREADGITTGHLDAELVTSKVGTPDAEYYFCGPKSFMTKMYHGLLALGVPASQIHFEFFGPQQKLEAATDSHS